MSRSSPQAPARERWNERYAHPTFEPFAAEPAQWLVEQRAALGKLIDGGGDLRAIDVACGDGRNARALAELGFEVDAVDVSDVAIAALDAAAARLGLRVHARVLDLEHDAPAAGAYDVVVCMNYLQRDLFASLAAALRPGGLLLYETFARAHIDELGRDFNPAFVLEDNELLHAFGGLHVCDYREGIALRGGEPRGVASILARRRHAAAEPAPR